MEKQKTTKTDFPGGPGVKTLPSNAEGVGLIPGQLFTAPSTDIFGEGNGTPLQYSCLENPMDEGAW